MYAIYMYALSMSRLYTSRLVHMTRLYAVNRACLRHTNTTGRPRQTLTYRSASPSIRGIPLCVWVCGCGCGGGCGGVGVGVGVWVGNALSKSHQRACPADLAWPLSSDIYQVIPPFPVYKVHHNRRPSSLNPATRTPSFVHWTRLYHAVYAASRISEPCNPCPPPCPPSPPRAHTDGPTRFGWMFTQ